MTPICSEHSALLKRIAANLNDRTARGVYADWLQERGEPAWYVVANYDPFLWVKEETETVPFGDLMASGTIHRYWYYVPWLEGRVTFSRYLWEAGQSPTQRTLIEYAEGKAK